MAFSSNEPRSLKRSLSALSADSDDCWGIWCPNGVNAKRARAAELEAENADVDKAKATDSWSDAQPREWQEWKQYSADAYEEPEMYGDKKDGWHQDEKNSWQLDVPQLEDLWQPDSWQQEDDGWQQGWGWADEFHEPQKKDAIGELFTAADTGSTKWVEEIEAALYESAPSDDEEEDETAAQDQRILDAGKSLGSVTRRGSIAWWKLRRCWKMGP